MKTRPWKVAFPLVVCTTLCLYAAKESEEADANVPPGVSKVDWHAISDDFGFVLQITQKPPALSPRKDIEIYIPDGAMDEEKREIRGDILITKRDIPRIGRAQAQFYARQDKEWYVLTTPPRPAEFHLLHR